MLYLSSHGFEGESYYKEILECVRDLDLEDLEQRQLQIDRDNDPSRHAEAEMVAARERAIATLEMEISAAHENDLERAHDFLYVLCLGWYVYGECCMAHSFEVIDVTYM